MAKRKSTKGQTRSRKHIYKTKDRVKRTPLKTEGELMCSGRVSSSCSTSGTIIIPCYHQGTHVKLKDSNENKGFQIIIL
jgi:hypothetical protein